MFGSDVRSYGPALLARVEASVLPREYGGEAALATAEVPGSLEAALAARARAGTKREMEGAYEAALTHRMQTKRWEGEPVAVHRPRGPPPQ